MDRPLLICGDAIEVVKRIRPGVVKAIWADIPDNLGLGYNSYKDNRGTGDYYAMIYQLIMEVLPKCGIFWLSYFPRHDVEIKWMVRDILKYHRPSFDTETYLWRYTFSQYNDKDCAYGYRPMLRFKRFDSKINPDAIRVLSQRQLIGDARAVGDRVPDNVWNIPRVTGNSGERRAWHPTQHPIALMERIILFSCFSGDLFVDLFAGTGGGLRAVLGGKAGSVDCISVELDSFYCYKIMEEKLGIEMVLMSELGKYPNVFGGS